MGKDMKESRRKIFDNFNDFINNQDVEPDEVCMFVYSILKENDYKYRPTGCYGSEWKLKDN